MATIALSGPDAWRLVGELFRPVSQAALSELQQLNRIYAGRFGGAVGDDVVLACRADAPEIVVEIHCHGGQQASQWIVQSCLDRGATMGPGPKLEAPGTPLSQKALELLPFALTERTAGILLDQASGSLDRALAAIGQHLQSGNLAAAKTSLENLLATANLGRHLTRPWIVAVAGPPNAGKSSLVNALAGYQRTVVNDLAGTTRDAAAVEIALDGWPIALVDTAGIRSTADDLERTGIEISKTVMQQADLVLWLSPIDEEPTDPGAAGEVLRVATKCDRPNRLWSQGVSISAFTGEGLQALSDAMIARLMPVVPEPGRAVLFAENQESLARQMLELLEADAESEEKIRLARNLLLMMTGPENKN